ncbi:MAG: hypothetical protein ACRCUY_11290 [Thermoguttaceae bacterium]
MSFGFSPIQPSAIQDAKAHERKIDSSDRAVHAQGVGGDDKEKSESASGDRDADGRLAWQWHQQRKKEQSEPERNAPDLSGQSGTTLDLSG